MYEFSSTQWLMVFLVLTLLIPMQQIIARAGHSRWWTLLFFVPIANWIALWILAYGHWPALDKPKT